MKKKIFLIIILLVGFVSVIYSQSSFRKAILLHRSTGASIYGPNGSNTSIPDECVSYNAAKSYTGEESVYMDEALFPVNNTSNGWSKWHNLFDETDVNDDIYPYIEGTEYDIIIIKTCYTMSGLYGWWYEGPQDTTNYPETFNIYVYQWHVRNVVRKMEQYPEKFFVIWNLAPTQTNPYALNDHSFSTWMTDTLAAGLDATYGAFPPNVYIFDYFHKMVDENYLLDPVYALSPSDDHPNAVATEYIAPLFVQEIFDAAFVYENASVPVELTLFSGYYEDGVVNLNWITATETNNYGFEVERSEDNSSYESIGFVNGNGTSTNRVTYNFIDNNLSSNRYYYRLKQIDFNGNFEYSNVLEIDFNTITSYSLEQNYPNPFNPSTEINFTLAKSGNITLKVYDNLGSEVATLADGFMRAGKHSVKFNLKDGASGIYYYRIKADNFSSTRKMLLIK
jgi:hypothetical protein